MYKSIKAIVLVIVVTVTFYLVAVTILFKGMNKFELNFETFEDNLSTFNECYSGEDSDLAKSLYHTDLMKMDNKELFDMMTNSFATTCDSRFVVSSEKQVSNMAKYLVENIDLKLVDNVYTTNSSYYAIINLPQEYLFFAMNDEKTQIAGYVVIPTKSGYEYIEVFNTTDVEEAKIATEKVLLFYNEQVQ